MENPMSELDFPETADRFIAYFDIMGFKDRVYREGHEEVQKMMDTVAEAVQYINKMKGIKENDGVICEKNPPIKAVTFSDSILFVAEGGSAKNMNLLLLISRVFLRLMFENRIPIKGALSYGRFTANFEKSQFFGRPLVDAYRLAEETYFYGATLHHRFEE